MSTSHAALSPLIALLNAWLNGDRLPALPRGITEIAGPHQLNGLLYHIAPQMSEFDNAICAQTWQRNAALHLKRLDCLARVWPKLAPEPLIFKGGDYCETIYGDPGARSCSDLDFLVPCDFDAIARELARSATEIRTPEQLRLPFTPDDSRGFIIDGCLLELHRQVVPMPTKRLHAKMLWEDGCPQTLPTGQNVRFPSAQGRLAIWLAQASKDAFLVTLMQLIDFIHIFASLPAIELHQIAELHLEAAYNVALARLQQAGFHLHAPHFKTPLPKLQAALVCALLPAIDEPKKACPPAVRTAFTKLCLWHPRDAGPKTLGALWHLLQKSLMRSRVQHA